MVMISHQTEAHHAGSVPQIRKQPYRQTRTGSSFGPSAVSPGLAPDGSAMHDGRIDTAQRTSDLD